MKGNLLLKSAAAGLLATVIVYFLVVKRNTGRSNYWSVTYEMKAVPHSSFPGAFSLRAVMQETEKRLRQLDLDFTIRETGANQYTVSIKNTEDTLAVVRALSSAGLIQFRELYHFNELMPMLQKAAGAIQDADKRMEPAEPAEPANRDTTTKALLKEMETREKMENTEEGTNELIRFNVDGLEGAEIGWVKSADTAKLRELFSKPGIKDAGPADALLCFGPADLMITKQKIHTNAVYFIRTYGRPEKALLENDDVAEAGNEYAMSGSPEVLFRFNNAGAQKWEVMTRRNTGRQIAILLDGHVISAPRVLETITGGNCAISGNFTEAETKVLAMQLKGSVIPARLSLLSAETSKGTNPGSKGPRMLILAAAFLLGSLITGFILKTLKTN